MPVFQKRSCVNKKIGRDDQVEKVVARGSNPDIRIRFGRRLGECWNQRTARKALPANQGLMKVKSETGPNQRCGAFDDRPSPCRATVNDHLQPREGGAIMSRDREGGSTSG